MLLLFPYDTSLQFERGIHCRHDATDLLVASIPGALMSHSVWNCHLSSYSLVPNRVWPWTARFWSLTFQPREEQGLVLFLFSQTQLSRRDSLQFLAAPASWGLGCCS